MEDKEQTPSDKRVMEQEKVVWRMRPNDPDLPAARRLLDRLRELAKKIPGVLDLSRKGEDVDKGNETYVIHAQTEKSKMSVGTQSPEDALKRAREMQSERFEVTITDRDGNLHTVQELEANIASGKYAKPASSGRY